MNSHLMASAVANERVKADPNQQRYWIAVVSKDHVMRGVAGGFMQVCHGKQAPLKRPRRNDWMLCYSAKASLDGTDKCQSFTAIGQISDDAPYQFQMSPTFIPYRRNVRFYDCKQISILPLIHELDFIPVKNKWGYPFRFGFFEIKEHDFNRIASEMIPSLERDKRPVLHHE